MKRMLVLAVVALFIGACGYPVQGPIGPKGDPGAQGPQATVPAIVWRNSADFGNTIIAIGEVPMHRDGNGNWWFVETDVGQVDQLKQPDGRIGFASTNCTGPSFYLGPVLGALQARPPFYPPRLPFFVMLDNEWRVRNDNARVQTVNIQSNAQPGGGCAASADGLHPVIPTGTGASHAVILPDLGSTGPLHMETFQD
jgi:hypothetical protein